MKKILFIFLMIFMTILVGCGESAKNEKELEEDFISEHVLFERYPDLEIDDFEVSDRKTDTNVGTDEVSLVVTASNDIFTYNISETVYYRLYDQGWIIDEREIIQSDVIIAEEYMKENGDTYTDTTEMIRNEYIVKEDIMNMVYYFSFYEGLTIDTLNITDRDIALAAGMDSFVCSVTASSEYVYYTGDYEIDYELVENEWVIEDFKIQNETVTPLKSTIRQVDSDAVLTDILEKEGGEYNGIYLEGDYLKLDENLHEFYYYANERIIGTRRSWDLIIICFRFSPEFGWCYEQYFTLVTSEP